LCLAYAGLGFDTACGHDEVFQALVLDRVIEPVSKLDSIRVLDEIGIVAPSYRTIVLLALHAGSVEVFGSCRCPYDGVVRDVAVALALSGTVWPM
jgi:hypothetical protein